MKVFRALGYVMAAVLVFTAAVIIMLSDAAVPDANGVPPEPIANNDNPAPTPKPSPNPSPKPQPLPQGEDLASARIRSAATGRPLVLLFGATWCAPCTLVHNELLPALRAKGELALIDVDEQPATYKHTCPGWALPALVVYNRTGNTWSLAGSCVGYDDIKIYATQVGATLRTWVNPPTRASTTSAVDVYASAGVCNETTCPGGNCSQPGDNAAFVFRGRWR